MAMNSGFWGVFKRSYHLLIIGAALVFLALALVGYLMGQETVGAKHYQRSIASMSPKHAQVEPLAMAVYSNAMRQMERPYRISIDTNETVGFFIPEKRIWCAYRDCLALLPPGTTKCPVCGTEQPVELAEAKDLDSDGGGIPDWWEKQYGLDPLNPDDDTIDSDGDGFSNLIEYYAGTDPLDPNSHPDLLDFMMVDKIVATKLPIRFMGATRMPGDKYRCQVNVLERGQLRPTTYFLLEGEQIGKTDFKLARYLETTEKRFDPRFNREMSVTVKKIEIARGGRVITIAEGENVSEADYKITLRQTLDNTTFEIADEGLFKIGEGRYKVISVDNQTQSVVLQNDASKKETTLSRETKFKLQENIIEP